MGLTEIFGKVFGGFTNDEQLEGNCRLEQIIFSKRIELDILYKILDPIGRPQNVVKQCSVVIHESFAE